MKSQLILKMADIQPLNIDTSRVYQLEPVTYSSTYSRSRVVGLITNQVQKHLPEIVLLDDQDKPCGIRYPALSAIMLSEMKKLKTTIEGLTKEVKSLKKEIRRLKTQAVLIDD